MKCCEVYPDPFCDAPIEGQGGSIKDGLSDRQPLRKPWEQAGATETPRKVYVEPHSEEKE